MDNPIITTAGFCAGVGWLDCGVQLALEFLGFRARTAVLCEWEAYAAAVLLARMEDESLEPCPIWCGDMRDFDGQPFRGVVDVAVAGLPCPAFSVAGKQAGLADERAWASDDSPIPQFLRIVGEMRPAVVFIENVPPFVRGGFFRPIGEELCRMGYTFAEPFFASAAAVGASHRRERVFILAYRAGGRFGELRESSRGQRFADGSDGELAHARGPFADSRSARVRTRDDSVGESGGPMEYPIDEGRRKGRRRAGVYGTQGSGGDADQRPTAAQPNGGMADTLRSHGQPWAGRQRILDDGSPVEDARGSRESKSRGAEVGQPSEQSGRPSESSGRCDSLADASGAGQQERQSERRHDGSERPALERNSLPLFAPGPGADWRAIPESLWPAIESGFRIMVTGRSVVLDQSRADQLRCSGNGVVALQAAAAFVELMRAAGSHP